MSNVNSSYAGKVLNSSKDNIEVRTTRRVKQAREKVRDKVPPGFEENKACEEEKLMQQQEGEAETSVTVDEVQSSTSAPGAAQSHQYNDHQGEGGGARPYHQQQLLTSPVHVSPPAIYSPGSPPLPLAAPLQLVYLQHTPAGLNIIPFQAVGYPSFSPGSPLGFPAHPNHPVVVHAPHHDYQPSGNPQSCEFCLTVNDVCF